MRIGQKSFIVFVSKFIGSILGFLATFYFARELGPEIFGTYTVVIALVFWLELAGSMGVTSAVTKRISEGEKQSEHFTAGVVVIAVLGLLIVSATLVARKYVNGYVGEPVTGFLILLLVVRLGYSLVDSTLQGEQLVHLAGISQSLKIAVRSVIQIFLAAIGMGLSGLLFGYAAGGLLVGIGATRFLSVHLKRPTRENFRSLEKYARFSWLGRLRYRSFNEIDILVLNAFVAPSLVGVYAVVWSIANFLTIFGNSISSTLFPEMSRKAATDGYDAVVNLVEDSLVFAGLVLIPGLVGAVIIGGQLLHIYGPVYTQGTAVLALLVLSTLLYTYQVQLLTALNAMDRPNLAFRINGIFILMNLLLNIVLVWKIGWVGAAVATVLSTGIGLLVAFGTISRIVSFRLPLPEIGRQVVSALFMGGLLWPLRRSIQVASDTLLQTAITLGLVVLGAGVYFTVLFALSSRLRETIVANLPIERFNPRQ
jgi:O-antigen/teichoic acid export membrane protein